MDSDPPAKRLLTILSALPSLEATWTVLEKHQCTSPFRSVEELGRSFRMRGAETTVQALVHEENLAGLEKLLDQLQLLEGLGKTRARWMNPGTSAPRGKTKARFRSTTVRAHGFPLAGQQDLPDPWDEPPVPGTILTAEEVRRRVKTPLVLVEDLRVAGRSRAEFERRAESHRHEELIRVMAGQLTRCGFSVYCGGATLPGVYAMADLLAVDGEELLFVECLTKASIKQGAHTTKLPLVERVPFLFVGDLPREFVAALPVSAQAIALPHEPQDLLGEWVPRFYRRPGPFKPVFQATRTRSSTQARWRLAVSGLRLAEDVSGFLWAALAEARHRKKAVAPEEMANWKVTSPAAGLFVVPFQRHGMPNSTFRLQGPGSELELRLGRVPVELTLRGTKAALELVQRWLGAVGFPLALE